MRGAADRCTRFLHKCAPCLDNARRSIGRDNSTGVWTFSAVRHGPSLAVRYGSNSATPALQHSPNAAGDHHLLVAAVTRGDKRLHVRRKTRRDLANALPSPAAAPLPRGAVQNLTTTIIPRSALRAAAHYLVHCNALLYFLSSRFNVPVYGRRSVQRTQCLYRLCAWLLTTPQLVENLLWYV